MGADNTLLDTPEPDGNLANALRLLDIAVRASRMYPPAAPTVVKAVDAAHASLVSAIGDEPV